MKKKNSKEILKKSEIEWFWWLHNTTCWLIKREGFVDTYFYLPTKRYVFKTSLGKEWRGTKSISNSLGDLISFSSETQALAWLSGDKQWQKK